MICKNCGFSSDLNSNYCTNCGEQLINEAANISIKCKECGTENEQYNSFCINCGSKLEANLDSQKNYLPVRIKNKKTNRKRSGNFKKSKSKNSILKLPKKLKLLWISTVVIIGSIIAVSSIDLLFHNDSEEGRLPFEKRSSNPIIEVQVNEIASKFVCSCGACNEEPLQTCRCERAVEERQFIRGQLEKNQTPNDVILAVANKYGWLKAEFASNYKVDASKIWNPNQLTGRKESDTLISSSSAKAMVSDKYLIYSSFNCPCGQCGVDRLIDCSCTHPNGAVEVKKFIDDNINMNKYTVSDIIEFVNTRYGGKIN